ncbi:hypothetical protein [Pseudoduganella sp. RAF53_2]|uniref:hypothetical protein n=1 Tax=unclassified Pseudoduganella TaxID=2637179 RepID=UPI003F9E899E
MAASYISAVQGVRLFHGLISPFVRYDDDGACYENRFVGDFHPEPDGGFAEWLGDYIYERKVSYRVFDHYCHFFAWLDHLKYYVREDAPQHLRNGLDFAELFESGPDLDYGPMVCRKLAADFRKWDSQIKADWGDEEGYQTYARFRECFEFACVDGAVGLGGFRAPSERILPRQVSPNGFGDEDLI